jgi:amino acid transporter
LPRVTAIPSEPRGLGLGTWPVFLASISTILGAIMFLRFGYAVGHAGLAGALWIVVIGHLVTIPTALAIAEIATNRRVEGGGEYFIISRSFGTTIGGSIGIALYLSQAISVAFYMIAFAEAFRVFEPWLAGIGVGFDPRIVSLPATIGLVALVVTRGANLGVKALWIVSGVLALSLVLFFLGKPVEGAAPDEVELFSTIERPDAFILVFAICFPAFTGMTAGVGLSGDLKHPSRSIPLGILTATIVGMIVYVGIVIKLALSATPELLAEDQLVMGRIALWAPIIPIGLACATISSAIGSILIAPRTLQALASDRVTPLDRLNDFLSRGLPGTNEPRNATLVTAVLAVLFVSMGDVDVVARIISMFFMVTYGALCAISFLEHFAARPSYRPVFRTKWYVSLLGAVMCVVLLLQLDAVFALLAIGFMVVTYHGLRLSRTEHGDDLAAIFRGAMTQLTRHMRIKLQRVHGDGRPDDWRPSIIMVDGRTFDRTAPLQLFSWLCQRYGFGTYLHFIKGRLDAETFADSRDIQRRLVQFAPVRTSGIYMDTIISPSMRTALAQSIQVPSISGSDNNVALFALTADDPPETRAELHDGSTLAGVTGMNSLVLRHGSRHFGARSSVHIWVRGDDANNARLMILLGYMLVGHPDWRKAQIRLFVAVPPRQADEQTTELATMLKAGRIPISPKNVLVMPTINDAAFDAHLAQESQDADIVMVGLSDRRRNIEGPDAFLRHPEVSDLLFVTARQAIVIE